MDATTQPNNFHLAYPNACASFPPVTYLPLSVHSYMVSELVKMFGEETQHDASLGPIAVNLLQLAASGLTSPELVYSSPDLVDDTFLLSSRCLSYAPRLLLRSPATVSALLETAMVGE